MGEQSEAVRQIATSGSTMQRIAEAIKLIKANFTKLMRVEDLARYASMSSSSFHYHFRAVTSMSPLQYQKQLRLLEARRLMLAEDSDATSAAYQVGYESPSQFNREYSRLFGAPPIRDIERSRIAWAMWQSSYQLCNSMLIWSPLELLADLWHLSRLFWSWLDTVWRDHRVVPCEPLQPRERRFWERFRWAIDQIRLSYL